MIYLTHCPCCYRNWKADTSIVGTLENGHIGFCPHCVHAMIFVGEGFRNIDKVELNDPLNKILFEAVRKQQDALAHKKGLFG